MKNPARHLVVQQLLCLLAQHGPATSFDLAARLKPKLRPIQVARILVYQRRYGTVEKIGEQAVRWNRYRRPQMTPLYAIPDLRERTGVLVSYGALPKQYLDAAVCDADDLAWMRAQQMRHQQKQQMRSRV